MAHIRRHPKTGKWQVRYVDPARKERSRTFSRRVDAEAYLHEVESKKNRGEYIDPDRGTITVAEWAEHWISQRRDLRPTTMARDRSCITNHLIPRFGSMPLNTIETDEIEAWVDGLIAKGLAPATVQKNYQLLNRILGAAVRSRRIAWNPATHVERLPQAKKYEPRFITPIEIGSIADAIHPRYRALVLVGGFCGLRFGEATAVKVANLDLLHRSLSVNATMSDVRGVVSLAEPKTTSSRRKVALPRFLVEELDSHISAWSSGDGWVFASPEGGPVRRTNWRRRFWLPAVTGSIGGSLRYHDLRHSHAAQLIAQGEHVKVIADRLGHASPMVTLNTYAHLFDGLDRDAADRLDKAWAGSVTDPRRTQAP